MTRPANNLILGTAQTAASYAANLGISRATLYYRQKHGIAVDAPRFSSPWRPCDWCGATTRNREDDGSPICARCARLPGPESDGERGQGDRPADAIGNKPGG